MENSNRFHPDRTKPDFNATLMLYLPPVLFGGMAACGGGIALQRPVAGLGLLVFALAGYIAVAALLAKAAAVKRADRVDPVISLVGEVRRG
jgi:hypothetical protein